MQNLFNNRLLPALLLLAALCVLPASNAHATIILDNLPKHLGDESGPTWVPPTVLGPQYLLNNLFGTSTQSAWVLTATFVNLRDVERGTGLASYDGHACTTPPGCDVASPQVQLLDGATPLWTGSINGNGTRTFFINRVVPDRKDLGFQVDAGQAAPGKFAVDGLDDFTWDAVVIFILDFSIFATRFNAVQPGQSVTNGRIHTKIAGVPYDLDVAALNFFGSGLGSSNDTIEAYVLDAVDNGGVSLFPTGCLTSWGTQVNALAATIDFSVTSNPALTTFLPFDNALREARLQFVEASAGGGGVIIRQIRSCSRDQFSIRPDTFTVTASDGDEFTAGTTNTLNAITPTGAPIHRAGSPFTMTVIPLNRAGNPVTGYDGSPQVSVDSLLLPVGGSPGVVTTPTWTTETTQVVSNDATWSEVGALRLSAQDLNFTSVDSSDGTSLAQRTVGPATADVGRFVPFDFAVVQNTPEFMPGCFNFSYLGQPFNYSVAPTATVTPINAASGTTTNYIGTQMRLSATPQAVYTAAAGTLDTTAIPVPDSTITPTPPADMTPGVVTVELTAGVAGIAFQRLAPVLPFDAEIAAAVNIVDDDNVAATSNPQTFGQAAATLGIDFAAASKQMRFGQLLLSNANGSDLTPLLVPYRVEFFDALAGGIQGFRASDTDACTDGLAVNLAADITLDESQLGGGASGQTLPTAFAGLNGAGAMTLSAPNARGTVGISLDLTPSYPWLFPDMDGDGAFDNPPTATAGFGVYGGNNSRIYVREATP